MKEKMDHKRIMAFKEEMDRTYAKELKKLNDNMFRYAKRRSGNLFAQDLPACFGSGNSRPWCSHCGVRAGC